MKLDTDQQLRADLAIANIFRKTFARQSLNGAARALHWAPPSLHRECQLIATDPEKARFIRAVTRKLCRTGLAGLPDDEAAAARSLTTTDSGLGQAVSVFEPLAEDIYALLFKYAAFRTLAVVPMDTGKKRYAVVTNKAAAGWITTQGGTIPSDISITGNSFSPEVGTLGTIVEVSGEALADGGMTFEGAMLLAIVEGLGYRLDFSCFQGDGENDVASGGNTGIFEDANVPVHTAGAGKATVATLHPDDFASCMEEVAPSALQYPCRWWIHPKFLPKLLKVRAGADDGSLPLLKPPTGPDDEWRIHGFPVTWTAGAPDADEAAAKIAAFGRPESYLVGLRRDFEIMSSAGAKFQHNMWLFRAIARARGQMRDATSLATLKLAAE